MRKQQRLRTRPSNPLKKRWRPQPQPKAETENRNQVKVFLYSKACRNLEKGETTSRRPWVPPRSSEKEGLKSVTCNSLMPLYASCPRYLGRRRTFHVRKLHKTLTHIRIPQGMPCNVPCRTSSSTVMYIPTDGKVYSSIYSSPKRASPSRLHYLSSLSHHPLSGLRKDW